MFHFASKGGYYLSAAFIQERPLIEHIRYLDNYDCGCCFFADLSTLMCLVGHLILNTVTYAYTSYNYDYINHACMMSSLDVLQLTPRSWFYGFKYLTGS